ncbi:MAG: hypothetical protein V1644_02665 [Candidatus Micrarchaeota archaeon]
MEEFVKMSPKGQLVVPQQIREEESLAAGDRFIALAMKEGVMFKRVKMPDVKAEFEKLSEEVRERFKKERVSHTDVTEAVKWARKK